MFPNKTCRGINKNISKIFDKLDNVVLYFYLFFFTVQSVNFLFYYEYLLVIFLNNTIEFN